MYINNWQQQHLTTDMYIVRISSQNKIGIHQSSKDSISVLHENWLSIVIKTLSHVYLV